MTLADTALVGELLAVILWLLAIFVSILIIIAPWRCWVHLKLLRREAQEASDRAHMDCVAIQKALRVAVQSLAEISDQLEEIARQDDLKITCPYCGTTFELPDQVVEGQHILCSNCGKKFEYHA